VQRRVNSRPQVREDVPPLFPAGLNDALEVGGERVATVALAAKARLPPSDQTTHCVMHAGTPCERERGSASKPKASGDSHRGASLRPLQLPRGSRRCRRGAGANHRRLRDRQHQRAPWPRCSLSATRSGAVPASHHHTTGSQRRRGGQSTMEKSSVTAELSRSISTVWRSLPASGLSSSRSRAATSGTPSTVRTTSPLRNPRPSNADPGRIA